MQLSLFFTVITLVSGGDFARGQFAAYWYYIVGLASGFGIQVGLYTYLRRSIRQRSSSGKVLAVSGTTSTVAMISCCSHYLVNILPIIGITGFLSLIGQYQIQLFWVGLALNLAGIAYIGQRVARYKLQKT